MSNFEIHGGVNTFDGQVGNIEAHGGVFYLKGQVGSITQRGGIIYDQRNRVEFKSDPEGTKELDRLRKMVDRLEEKLKCSEEDNLYLRKKLNKATGGHPVEDTSDNVLVARIESLQRKLKDEREAHRKEVDELKWRLEAVTDIANGRHERIYKDETNGRKIEVPDTSFEVFFTLINEYPIGTDGDIAEELGISVQTLKYIAKVLRLAKSPEQRREARERLQRHGLDLIERRGGGQTKGKRKPKKKKK